MQMTTFSSDVRNQRTFRKWSVFAAGWTLAVLLFASQWCLYDSTHDGAAPLLYYMGWSLYMWAVLTPLVLWFSNRCPIDAHAWKSAIPLHILASIVLTVLQVSIETYIGWLRGAHSFSFGAALPHYFSRHIQLSLLTYWALVAAGQFYRMHDQARKRQLHAARLEARLAEAQLDVLRMQLQPHFLFNTLQAATVLIHEDPDGAEDILLRLSKLLRISLDGLHVQEIPLAREIQFLEYYVGIQQRRFGDRLHFELRVDDDVLACAVPSLLLQPLVENAVRHGIGKHKESDTVSVHAFQNAGQLHIEVRNGASTLTKPLDELLGSGTGLANTQARLRQLYDDQQSIELSNLEPKGVRVVLTLPVRLIAEQDLQLVESHQ